MAQELSFSWGPAFALGVAEELSDLLAAFVISTAASATVVISAAFSTAFVLSAASAKIFVAAQFKKKHT